MIIQRPLSLNSDALPVRRLAGFTLPNLLVWLSIFLLVMGGVLATHIFGMRLMSVTQVRLSATDYIPRNMQTITDDLHAAQRIRIGQFSSGIFQEVSSSAPRQGSAAQLFFSADTNSYICYYWDSADNKIKRRDQLGVLKSIFDSVSNSNVFAAEDFAGNIITNDRSYYLISLDLKFYALNNAQVQLASNQVYTSYELHTRVARRSLD